MKQNTAFIIEDGKVFTTDRKGEAQTYLGEVTDGELKMHDHAKNAIRIAFIEWVERECGFGFNELSIVACEDFYK